MLKIFALVAVLIVTALPVAAGFKEGAAAYKRGDYKTAIREFTPYAERGDAATQYLLGELYRTGRGTPKNNALAVKWYRKSAEQGFASAQFNLGLMYIRGLGVPKNNTMTFFWWSLASARGHKGASKNLGVVEKRMSSAQVAKAQAMVEKWKPTKTEQAE